MMTYTRRERWCGKAVVVTLWLTIAFTVWLMYAGKLTPGP